MYRKLTPQEEVQFYRDESVSNKNRADAAWNRSEKLKEELENLKKENKKLKARIKELEDENK